MKGSSSPLRHLPWPFRTALGAVLAALAVSLTFALDLPDSGSRFLLAYPAIVAAAVLAGRHSGYVSTGISTGAFAWALASTWRENPDQYGQLASLLLFATVGAATTAVLSDLKRARLAAEAANIELAAARDEARALQEQADLLLRELRHRVKNDVTNAVSLLRLQAQRLSGPERVHLETAADRLMVLSKVHERLARQGHSPVVDIGDFLERLCEDLNSTMFASRSITLQTDFQHFEVASSEAVAVGLIVNELLTNAIKYAFAEDGGVILVRLKTLPCGTAELEVSDNGRGFEPGARAGGLGQRLVRSLVAQLRGKFDCRSGPNGTECLVHYRRAPDQSASSRRSSA